MFLTIHHQASVMFTALSTGNNKFKLMVIRDIIYDIAFYCPFCSLYSFSLFINHLWLHTKKSRQDTSVVVSLFLIIMLSGWMMKIEGSLQVDTLSQWTSGALTCIALSSFFFYSHSSTKALLSMLYENGKTIWFVISHYLLTVQNRQHARNKRKASRTSKASANAALLFINCS